MMRPLLILAALLFAGSEIAQSQIPPPAPSKNSEHQKNHPATSDAKPAYNPAGTDKQPFVVKSLEAEKTPERAEQERPEREEKAANERSLIVWTIVLACATILLALLAGGQIYLFWWQLGLIRDGLADTKEAADAARKSADAAESTVITMKDTAQRQLRAYVFVDSAEIIDLKADFIPVARLIVKNSGQTPAYDLMAIGGIAMGESFDRLPPPTGPSAISRSTLSAGSITDQLHKAPRPLAPIEMAALDAGTITLWVYGEFHYRDTFDIERFTKYRFQVGGTAGVRGNKLAVCEEGNKQT